MSSEGDKTVKDPSSIVVTPVRGWRVSFSPTKIVAKGMGCFVARSITDPVISISFCCA